MDDRESLKGKGNWLLYLNLLEVEESQVTNFFGQSKISYGKIQETLSCQIYE